MNERPDAVIRNIRRRGAWAALASVVAVLTVTLATGATPRQGAAAQAPAAAGAGAGQAASGQAGSGQGGSNLPMPVDEIIRRFAQHESDFKLARENYTYSQEVLIQEPDQDGGEYRLESEIVFTPQGKRYENVTYAPPSTLHRIMLTPEDTKDLENIQPFVLTTEDLPKYDVKFTGREKIDEVNTYVFQVAPKHIEKNQRYFQGTIWVDDHDLAVVKSDGKAVPDIKENLFPRFVTYRENIEGSFWFPTYTHADDDLHFKTGDVRIRMTVRYKNYKRFGSTIKLGPSRQVDTPANPPAAPQK